MRHRIRGIAFWIGLFSFAFLLQACSSIAYLPGQQTVGRLRTVGPNVYLNETPARDGQMIRVTDHLRTGPDSSAFVYTLDGGLIQLDENTEPSFRLVWDGKECRVVSLGLRFGQAYQESGHQCLMTARTSEGALAQQETGGSNYRGPTEHSGQAQGGS